MPRTQPGSGGGGVARTTTDCSKAVQTFDGNTSKPLPTIGIIGIGGEGIASGCPGVFGSAVSAPGVSGSSESDAGVEGVSQQSFGVYGSSANSWGVIGHCDSLSAKNAGGVRGEGGIYAPGIWGSGNPAGHFAGDVVITGKISGGQGRPAAYLDGDCEINGNLTMSGGIINLTNGGDVQLSDCAEDFEVASAEEAEPGTIMVIDETGVLKPSEKPYDKRVAGIISGAGTSRPAIVINRRSEERERAPLALFGAVYCKVDCQYGRIEVGDLLTASATRGHAMKAADPLKAFGAVIGKALRGLDSGRGLIPVLVSLQ